MSYHALCSTVESDSTGITVIHTAADLMHSA